MELAVIRAQELKETPISLLPDWDCSPMLHAWNNCSVHELSHQSGLRTIEAIYFFLYIDEMY